MPFDKLQPGSLVTVYTRISHTRHVVGVISKQISKALFLNYEQDYPPDHSSEFLASILAENEYVVMEGFPFWKEFNGIQPEAVHKTVYRLKSMAKDKGTTLVLVSEVTHDALEKAYRPSTDAAADLVLIARVDHDFSESLMDALGTALGPDHGVVVAPNPAISFETLKDRHGPLSAPS